LREPIRTLVSFTALLEETLGKSITAEAKEYMAITRNAAHKMESMIADLLEYSRLTHEAERLTEIDCNLKLEHALEMLHEAIDSTGATIEAMPLPHVYANAPRFIRLLQNLIGNGLKYQLSGNKPVIRINAEDKGDNWLFMVADNGIGIAPEFAEHIFLPFKRLHNQSEYVGSGIGLAICKRIVENFGGRIYVESEPGKGSRFFFTVPKR
jgi:light-regulated signal transduction histidine kinase (bacteriophytochrome)